MKNKIYHLIFVALITSIFYAEIVLAQYGYFPHQFYGSVIVNNVSAPDGVLISAKFDGKDVEGGLTKNGKYGYETGFIVALQEKYAGDTIEFYVQNVKAAEHVFAPGYATELNLSVNISNFCGDGNCESGEDCSSCPSDCGTCPSPGPGPGPSPGPGPGPGPGPIVCEEDWTCTDWFECVNNVQTRTCADNNRCGTTEGKPIERQDCVTPVICEPDERKCEGDTLMVCSALGTTWISLQECEFGCADGECLQEEAPGEEAPSTDTIGLIITGMATFFSNPVYTLLFVLLAIAIILIVFRGRILATLKKK